jgi:acetyltransferase-like isoleucine patch superfamily enzyme
MTEPALKRQVHPTASVSPDVEYRGGGTISVGPYCVVEARVTLDTGTPHGVIVISSRSKIKAGALLRCYGNEIHIGHRVSVGEYCLIAAHGGVKIGDFSMIGPYTMINAATHIIGGDEQFRFQGEIARGVEIGEDVWIGARCTVLDNVQIASRSIVGAHSLVNRSTRSRTISVGTPARLLKNIQAEEKSSGRGGES